MSDDKENVIGDELTLKQERFCRYYTQAGELFGQGTLSYAKAYEYDLDNATNDDGLFELPDGSTMRKYEMEDIEFKTETKFTKYRQVEKSTYEKMYHSCAANASRLLTSDRIIKRIRELLNEQMNDEVIDSRLTEIIMKGKDVDSIAAIKEYNKLKQRIVDKLDLTSKGEAIGGFNFIRNENKENNSDNKTDSETAGSLGRIGF